MDTTAQAVACRYCGEAAQVLGDDGWLCDGCYEAERLISRYRADEEHHYWMGRYLTSRWTYKDEDGTIRCRDCNNEPLVLGPECHCGFDGRK